jgi:hypothetical protein
MAKSPAPSKTTSGMNKISNASGGNLNSKSPNSGRGFSTSASGIGAAEGPRPQASFSATSDYSPRHIRVSSEITTWSCVSFGHWTSSVRILTCISVIVERMPRWTQKLRQLAPNVAIGVVIPARVKL